VYSDIEVRVFWGKKCYVHGRRKQSVSLNLYRGYFEGGREGRPDPDVDHSPPDSVEVFFLTSY
jgi:hypothetical protein